MAPGATPARLLDPRDLRVEAGKPRRVRQLGQEQGVGPGRHHGGQIRGVLGGAGRVDAHDALAASEVHRAQRRDDPLPRLGLLRGRHRVLQVEDDAVGGHRRRLGDALGPRAGNEQEAATEPGHAPPRRCESTSNPAVRSASTSGRGSQGSRRTLNTVFPSDPGTAPTLMMRPSCARMISTMRS